MLLRPFNVYVLLIGELFFIYYPVKRLPNTQRGANLVFTLSPPSPGASQTSPLVDIKNSKKL